MKLSIDNLTENQMEVIDYNNPEIKKVIFDINIKNFNLEFDNEFEFKDFIKKLSGIYSFEICLFEKKENDK